MMASWLDTIALWILMGSGAMILLAGIVVLAVLLGTTFGVWALLAIIPLAAAVWLTIRDDTR